MSPEERALGCVCYVNAVGWEDGDYGGLGHSAHARLRSEIAAAIRAAVVEEREACAKELDLLAARHDTDVDRYAAAAATVRRRNP